MTTLVKTTERVLKPVHATTALFAALVFSCAAGKLQAQDLQPVGPMPYDIPVNWIEPFAGPGFSWGGNSGIHVESEDRIIVLQRGETELPDPVPPEYTNFPGSMGWNVIQGQGRTWQNVMYVINSEGDVLEVWDHWDHLFAGTEGPGPHRLRVSPYDPERRIWVVDETNHVIYVFSQDGQQLLMTLGEKGVAGDNETHFGLPQDVAFLPDGKVLVADGLQNARVVILDPDGRYLSQFGSRGQAPGEFATVHGLAMGPGHDVYVVDRNNMNVQVFRQTNRGSNDPYPTYEFKMRVTGPNFPLDIIVSEDYFWVTDIRPPKIMQFDLQGNHIYTWLLPVEGPTAWLEMHSFSVDADGNVYGTDNQYARPQKLVPKADAEPRLLIQPQFVPQ